MKQLDDDHTWGPREPDGQRRAHASPTITRRALGGGALALAIAGASSRIASAAPPRPSAPDLAALERRTGGRLGVHAVDLQSGRELSYRADERFRLMSTFKGFLTAMALREVAAGRERLDAPVAFGPSDLLSASPVTTANVRTGHMTVGELCEAAMVRSDNAAANLLMRRLGGPSALTRFLRSTGDAVTQVDHYEGPQLGSAALPADSSTPSAVVTTLRRILMGRVLAPAELRLWQEWMVGTVTGRTRLRAAFQASWRSGDRTGTADGICNDFAFAFPPGRAPLLVAAYHNAPGMDLEAQEALLRDVGHLVASLV